MTGKRRIAIIGAGASGTVAAIDLMRKGLASELILIDSNPLLHRGLAYSTKFASHLLNVPALKMSIIKEEPDDFLIWLKESGFAAHPKTFAPRMHFGNYLQETFERIAENSATGVRILADNAASIEITKTGFKVSLTGGQTEEVDKIIVASGWQIPSRPHSSPKVFDLTYKLPETLQDGKSATIIGTGLTAIDTVLSIRNIGFEGQITMISRRGVIPQTHMLEDMPEQNFSTDMTLRQLFRFFKVRAKERKTQGLSWHGLLDGFRPKTQEYWKNLSLAEKSRFLRHARPYWDVHRHRMAEEISTAIHSELGSGKLQIIAAKISNVIERESHVEIKMRQRGKLHEIIHKADILIKASGADVLPAAALPPLFQSMILQDLAVPDVFSLGLNCTFNGELLDSKGQIVPGIFAIGPVARANLWESVAMPEIVSMAGKISDIIQNQPDPEATHSKLYSRVNQFDAIDLN